MLRLLFIFLAVAPLVGQDILDLRGGIVYHAEDCVYLDTAHTKPLQNPLYRLQDGETLATGEGFVEVLVGMGNVFRLGPESAVTFRKLGFRETEAELLYGMLVWNGRSAIEPGTIALTTPAGLIRMEKDGELWAFAGDATALVVEKGRWTRREGGKPKRLSGDDKDSLQAPARLAFQQMEPWNKDRERRATERRIDRMRDAQESEKRRYDPRLFR